MKKVIVTLRDQPAGSVEVPREFPRRRGEKEKKSVDIERSCFGCLRFFPGVPRTISEDELAYIEGWRGDLFGRLDRRPYVESKRVDYRGASESAIEALAEKEGIGHLDLPRKVARLTERRKLDRPDPRKSTETRILASRKDGGTARKPKK